MGLLCEAVINGDWGSGVHGSSSSTPPEYFFWDTSLGHCITSQSSDSLWHTVKTLFRITLRSLAWLVCSWSATPEMPRKSRCMRSSALWNPAGPLGFDFFGLESLPEELLVFAGLEGEGGEREGMEVERLVWAVVVGRGSLADGSVLSTGWLAPKRGKGSTSSRTTLPSAPVVDTDISTVLGTGRGSKTVLEESLESRLIECLLCSCEGEGSASPLLVEGEAAVDCPSWADSGLLGGVAAVISLDLAPSCRPLGWEWEPSFLLCLAAFFLEAVTLSLLCSSVPSPSALHRAFSNVSTCSGVRCPSSSLNKNKNYDIGTTMETKTDIKGALRKSDDLWSWFTW